MAAHRKGLRRAGLGLGLGLGLASACGGGSSSAEAPPKAAAGEAGEAGEPKAGAGAGAKEASGEPATGSLDPSTLPGSILFVSERDGNLEIYRVRLGQPPQRLTDDPEADFVGEVFADGWTRVSTRDGAAPEDHREQLWWMPYDGTPVSLGPEGRRARSASWAPDRAFVVFESDAEGAFSDLWRWSAADGLTRLTTVKQGAFEPAVSPDGRRVAHVSGQDGNPELYVMNADGSAPRRLTDWRRDDFAPRWSPDGTQLAFLRREQGGERLFTMSVPEGDGEPVERRIQPTAEGERVKHGDHAWSPDGTMLAYTVHRPDTAPQVVVTAIADGSTRVVSPAHLRATQPSWSPDGKTLAFTGTPDDPNALDLYVVALEGGAWAKLTTHAAPDWLPRWSPT